MLQQVSLSHVSANKLPKTSFGKTNATNSIAKSKEISNIQKVDVNKLLGAYRGYNNIRLASSVSFGSSFADAFETLNKSMVTCQDEEHGKKGEDVGSRVDVSRLTSMFVDDMRHYDDAIKTTIPIFVDKEKDTVTDARTQIKKGRGDVFKFEMTVRPPRDRRSLSGQSKDITQNIEFQLVPYEIKLDKDNRRYMSGTPETAYVLNTKGKLMAVIEDGEDVLLTAVGRLRKKDSFDGFLGVNATKPNNQYHPFKVENVPPVAAKQGGSLGGGTELVIGLEDGRFIPEIIESIEEFQRRINSDGPDKIVLDKFVPAPDVQNIQIGMLAGGFGSRAEYANASSSKIMHNKKDGSNLTKGCFRTATGLTPMETSFISLHKAGYLDCSKENFGIGKNIKFYINDKGKNGGNGSFSVDMYNTMARDGRKSLLILPNDAMSRIPDALKKMNDKINSGDAAMVMVAKEVDKEDARGSLGIMKINDRGEIEEFDEKPKEFAPGYVDKNGKCFANTFQFAVSDEAFEVLNMLEPYLAENDSKKKEARDWSKTYTPIIMAITQNDDPAKMNKSIRVKTGLDIPVSKLYKAKQMLHGQKIYAIKSDEPWADCGTLDALYHTTMQIASGVFPLEDFERAHVLESVNTQTGLIASSKEQKEKIEKKYEIDGQVMVVPKAKPADPDVVERNEFAITRYSSKH